jgi:hypothetical protein
MYIRARFVPFGLGIGITNMCASPAGLESLATFGDDFENFARAWANAFASGCRTDLAEITRVLDAACLLHFLPPFLFRLHGTLSDLPYG